MGTKTTKIGFDHHEPLHGGIMNPLSRDFVVLDHEAVRGFTN
jgi:hypothetical protein